jgi:integrase
MSSLYKRQNSPYYSYSTYIRGKRVRMSTGMRAMNLAKTLQIKWDFMLINNDLSFLTQNNVISGEVEAFMDEYLKLRSRASINTYDTARTVTKRLKCFLKGIGIHTISEITVKSLDEYIDYLDTSPKTKHNHIKEIKIMLDRAMIENHLDRNPAKHVTLPRIIKVDRHRMLEPQDLQIIFNGAGSWKLYFEFLYRTGLRAGDVARLTYGNIDFKRSAIISLVRKSRRIHEFPLSEMLISLLNKGEKNTPLFPILFSNSDRTLSDNLAKPRKYMQALLQAEDRPKATLHSFRTTFNNTLRDLGLDIDDRRILLAHSSSETTKIYTHPNLEMAKKWVDKMPVYGMD